MVFTEQTGSSLKLNGNVWLPSARDRGTEPALGSPEATGMGGQAHRPPPALGHLRTAGAGSRARHTGRHAGL